MQPCPVFGFEEFWPEVYERHKRQFDAIGDLIHLGNEAIEIAEATSDEPVKNVICFLTRATISGACEVIVLCGNGYGAGAMKIVRGMYESRWMSEYLRLNPKEVEDYLEFSKVLLWRRLKWTEEYRANSISPGAMKKAEADYQQVVRQFTDGKGKVRQQWSKKSIGKMAREIGREKEYELPYSIACSIHHQNFEGLLALFVSDEDGEVTPNLPPSRTWVNGALTAAWANLWFALNTLNSSCGLHLEKSLEAAQGPYLAQETSSTRKCESEP